MKSVLMVLLFLIPAQAQDADPGKPITEIDNIKPEASVFVASSAKKPLVLKSAGDAGKSFNEAELKKLTKHVDFDKQIVLVFAWKGSGQDKLAYHVAESSPEQITFKYQPGRTRDFRPHTKIFVLRDNVKWTVK